MAAGSFKIYGLQKDGSRIPAAGSAGDGVASDALKLGGKAPEYYIQPRNLLDNSDFRKPVNQRGNTEITGDWNYGIDRWLVSTKYEQNPNGSILITDNGLSMGYWTDMMQLIPFEQLKSKTLTFAVCTENGVYAYTMTLPESVPPVGGGAMYFGDGIWNDIIVMETIKYDNNDSVMFRFRNAQTTNQLVYWAALYEGAYTAETLPPYVPKQYAVELAECQRYYRRIEHTSNMVLFPAIAYNTKSLYGTLPFGFRVKPTIRVSNVVFCKSGISTAKTVVSCTAVGTGAITSMMVSVNEGDAVTGDTYNIWTSPNGGYMELSADL